VPSSRHRFFASTLNAGEGVPLSADAFVYVPSLHGKILEPEQSRFRISRATFDQWDKRPDGSYDSGWRRSHEDREATRHKALAGRLDRDVWIFAYGSLMWDPAMQIAEIRRAELHGFHRRFCLRIEIGRGSKEAPALMAGLDVGGNCHGLAFRIPGEAADRETEILWMREMMIDGYAPAFLPISTPQGPVEALAFVADRSSPRYLDLSAKEAAAMIAAGNGVLGTNLDYLDELAERFAVLGIEDEAFENLQSRIHDQQLRR
jgi:cation transport protein ChaC